MENAAESRDALSNATARGATKTESFSALETEANHKLYDDTEQSPVEQVALTVATTDDPSMPVWTFRMWTIGLLSCMLLSFLNQFFAYRKEPLIITLITVQVAALPIGHFLAFVLPTREFPVPLTNRKFSLNPGPFNVKEHVLITIFANAGSDFGNGSAYAVGVVTIVKAFYHRKISFMAGWFIIITTQVRMVDISQQFAVYMDFYARVNVQVLGYGWAGLFRKYLIEPVHMWWPSTLVQVSLFRTLHEKRSSKGLSRSQFFVIFMIVSFAYYALPGGLLNNDWHTKESASIVNKIALDSLTITYVIATQSLLLSFWYKRSQLIDGSLVPMDQEAASLEGSSMMHIEVIDSDENLLTTITI
ncbi:hypothetical protein L7F22_057765 [Adiantum nelumboides]|nr:hypothetical protein [Adiantum nelumboides]